MKRHELTELCFIVPISTVPSILKNGILCHRLAERLNHESIANQSVQDIRANKIVPGGKPLHDYANLYVCARNPMMFVRRNGHESLCVLRVSTDVLDLPGVVVTDANASRTFARFRPAPDGLEIVNRELTLATYWTHPDEVEQYRRKGLKCAEVLVPRVVPVKYILGAYVSCEKGRQALAAVAGSLPITVNANLFFN